MECVSPTLSKIFVVSVLWFAVCDAGLQCNFCNETAPSCDVETGTCRTCDETVECPDYSLCIASWFIFDIKKSEVVPEIGCFTLNQLAYESLAGIYHSRCDADFVESSLTCLCTTDNCNGIVHLPEGIFPEYKDETVTGFHENTSSVIWPVTGTAKIPDRGTTDLPVSTTTPLPSNYIIAITLSVIVPLSVFGAFVTITCCVHRHKHRKLNQDRYQKGQSRKGSASNDLSSHVDFTYDSESKHGVYETINMSDFTSTDFETTDSNQNLSVLIQSLIGQGRFAKIWKGILVKEGFQRSVAVKIFSDAEQKSWTQEAELYSDLSVCLKHPNILEYIGSEERIRGNLRQYWLVTAFHERGSLRDYLSKNILSWNELCTMGKSIFSGAAYMHSYAFGQDYLPKIPVAHRDIKSSNVLVKIDGTCTIADFGLALKLDPNASIAELANSGQAGTPRYMAPEALDSKINLNDIESFKQCDMYALSLIMWEMMSRCSILADVGEYKLPYSNRVNSDPTIEMMKCVLLRDKYRPEVPQSWREHKGMRPLVDSMVDCWDDDPEARLTASCVEYRFCNLCRLDDADFDIFTDDVRLLDDFDSGMASSMSQVTSSHDSTSVSSPQHSPTKHPKLSEKRSTTSSEFSDESGLMITVDIASPSHKGRYVPRGYLTSINSDITEENEVTELASDDDLPAFPESIAISFD